MDVERSPGDVSPSVDHETPWLGYISFHNSSASYKSSEKNHTCPVCINDDLNDVRDLYPGDVYESLNYRR